MACRPEIMAPPARRKNTGVGRVNVVERLGNFACRTPASAEELIRSPRHRGPDLDQGRFVLMLTCAQAYHRLVLRSSSV